MNNSERLEFWNRRILPWDQFHYRSPFSFIAQRERVAYSLLKKHVKSLRLLELGCGTGRLGPRLVQEAQAKSYLGVDLSDLAIQEAQKRPHPKEEVQYLTASFDQIDPTQFDLVFSLGLFDWLYEHEQQAIATLPIPRYLHSFSEVKDWAWLNIFHRSYSKLYTKQKSEFPRHQFAKDVQRLFHPRSPLIHRSARMYLSCFAHNLYQIKIV